MDVARDGTGISEGSSLIFYSLLSCRRTLPPGDLESEYVGVHEFLRTSGLCATGPFITVLHEGLCPGRALFLDLEILVPIPGENTFVSPYSYIPRLRIGNAVSLHYEGPLSGLRSCYEAMYGYMRDRNLEPLSRISHVSAGDGAMPARIDPLSVDIYISVKSRPA